MLRCTIEEGGVSPLKEPSAQLERKIHTQTKIRMLVVHAGDYGNRGGILLEERAPGMTRGVIGNRTGGWGQERQRTQHEQRVRDNN